MLGSSPTHHASFAPDTNFSSSEEAASPLEEADEGDASAAPGRSRTSDGGRSFAWLALMQGLLL